MAVATLAALLIACDYNAKILDCRVVCNATSGCPDGLSCSASEGLCRTGETTTSCATILDGGGSDAQPTLSCLNLASNCGPAGTASCCGSPLVPGGTFYRGYDVASDNMYPSMAYPATVSAFRLDTYEVTVGRFRQFVNAGMGTQADPPPTGAGARPLNGMASQGGWDPTWNASLTASTAALIAAVKCDSRQSWTDAAGANEALPMNCITWFEAFAFCTWDGGFLPTDAEWNYAAAGGGEQRAYPWSSPASLLSIDCSYSNYDPNYPNAPYCVGTGNVSRVGSLSPKGDNKWGHADLAGNAWEWTLDWFHAYSNGPCDDCADLTPAVDRVFRGGSEGDPPSALRTANRVIGYPGSRGGGDGVRCARPAL